MNTKRFYQFMAIITILSMVVGLPRPVYAATTIYVPDNYPTIQAAVDAANPGDMVFVRAGIYYEHVVINTTLTLQGEDKATTIIDGGGSGYGIHMPSTDNVVISGFTVRNTQYGIFFSAGATYNTVSNIIATGSFHGINNHDQGENHNTFQNVEVYGNTNAGISAYAGSDDIKILDSNIHDNAGAGIQIGWSSNWTVSGNTITGNVSSGVTIDTASYGTVANNTITGNNTGVSFGGWGPVNNNITDNIIRGNTIGLDFTCDARYNTVTGNEISDSTKGVIIDRNDACPNYGNTFHHNTFKNNSIQAQDNEDRYGGNTWDNGYPSGGNTWDTYTGVDLFSGASQDVSGADGIGDTPYVILAGLDVDRYPLVPAHQHDPTIQVWLTEGAHSVSGRNWPENSLITLTIEDPATPESPDLTSTQIASPCWWGADQGCTYFEMGNFQYAVGQVITMSDMTYTKQFTVTSLSLKIMSVDPATDIVTGTAAPNSLLAVEIGGVLNSPSRMISADSLGNWTANFAVAGPGEGIFDIVPGTSIWNAQNDNDGDCISDYFTVPAPLNPNLHVFVTQDRIEARDWLNGNVVTLTIDRPSTPQSPDYTTSRTMGPAPWNPNEVAAEFNLNGVYHYKAGDLITVSDGTLTKTHTVSNVAVTNIDPVAETISGTTDPGAEIQVEIHRGGAPYRRVTADGNGDWSVDFSVPWNDQGTYDLTPSLNGAAMRYDADGDASRADWSVPNPVIWAHPNDSGEDWIDSREWVFGETLQMTIDDDTDPSNGVLYTDSGVVDPANWNPSVGTVEFHLGNFDLKPGHIVTVTSPTTSKTLVITNLDVTDINPDMETISGTAAAGSAVQAWFHEEHTCDSEVDTNENGIWMVDFHPCDLRPGIGGGMGQKDADEDSTVYFWNVLNPNISIHPDEDWLEGYDWPAGVTVNISIDDPATTKNPDFTGNAVVGTSSWNPSENYFSLDLRNLFDIKAGFLVNVTDGQTTKEHEVTSLVVTNADAAADTISGTSSPNVHLRVDIFDTNVSMELDSDSNGNWTADFTGQYDLTLGTRGRVQESDSDWDNTGDDWSIPNPNFSARLNENQVHGYEWTLDSSVTLTIDDPDNGVGVDYTDTKTVGIADWNPDQTFVWFDLGSFTLESGQLVSMSQGGITKTHTVTNLTVTTVNTVAETVSGTAEPGTQVDVGHIYCDQNGCVGFRRVIADTNGNWIADFAHVGEDSDEQDIVDIQVGAGSEARQCDNDGECTAYGWYVPNPTIAVRANDNRVEGWEWTLGSTITVTLDDPGTPLSPDITRSAVVYEAPWNPGEFRFDVDLNDEFDIKAGDVVTASDDVTTKIHIVTNLAFDEINPNADIVLGHASPNIQVNVWACDNTHCVNREEMSNQSGNWQSNFSTPGDLNWEQDTFDIQPGTWVDSSQNDEDGDGTYFGRIAGSTFSGTVYAVEVAPENRVAGVMIEACTADNFCKTALTDGDGNYWLGGLQAGTYSLRAISPGSNLPGSLGPVDISYDEILYGQNIVVPAPPLPPPPNAIEPAHSGGGTTVVYWLDDLTLTTHGCANGAASFKVTVLEDGYIMTGPMTETPTGSGTYLAAIPSLYPHHGVTLIEFTITCPGGSTEEVQFPIYIDPSGVVKTVSGNPIPDATVTLFYSENADGPFTEVPDGSVQMSPSNRKNPDTTNANGQFGWDVVAGFYKVRAEKAGCYSPTDPLQLFVESAVLTIPPPVTGLELILKCPLPPSASAGGPYSIHEGGTVTLDASASSDPEAGLLTYEWDLDNDGQYDNATGVTITKTFADNGVFPVSVRVTDPDTLSETDTAQIDVANVSPIVTIQQASTNSSGILSGNGSFTDPGADSWIATVNYGDGSGVQSLTLHPDKSFLIDHSYLTDGVYTVEVCVSDDDSGSGCDQAQVTVATNRPPIAKAGGPYSGNEGTTITLNASKSTDPDHNIVRYEWDFDSDGQFDDATGVKPKFVAIDNGTFLVRVRVTDAGGLSSIAAATITVKNLPPLITSISIDGLVRVGAPVNGRVTFKDAGVKDTFTAVWKWGDGSTSTGSLSGYILTGSHTYTKPGVYIIVVVITDKDGGKAQISTIVIVLPKR